MYFQEKYDLYNDVMGGENDEKQEKENGKRKKKIPEIF